MCQIIYKLKWIMFFVFQKDLSPLVRQLAPSKIDDGAQIPYVLLIF